MKSIIKLFLYLFVFVLGYLFVLLILRFNPNDKKILHDILTALWVIFVIYMLRIKVEKKPWADFGFNKKGFIKFFIQGVLIGLLLVLFFKIFLVLFGLAYFDGKSLLNAISLKNIDFIVRVFFLSLLVTFFEELIFRGLFYSILSERLSTIKVILILSLIYATFHSPKSYLLFIGLMMAGVVLAYSRYLFKSLEFPWGLHFSWILFLQYLNGLNIVNFKDGIPVWLVGYNYNPASGVLGFLLLSALIPGIRFLKSRD